MDLDSVRCDVAYAAKQLEHLKANRHCHGAIVADIAQRALDALERVEAALAATTYDCGCSAGKCLHTRGL